MASNHLMRVRFVPGISSMMYGAMLGTLINDITNDCIWGIFIGLVTGIVTLLFHMGVRVKYYG